MGLNEELKKIENNLITENDLNDIDKLNGQGQVSYKGKPPADLKGALNQFNKAAKGDPASFDSTETEKKWIYNYKNNIFNYLIERIDYKNLPFELDKYKIEKKILENGSVAIVKGGEYFYACNYTFGKYDMYNNPTEIKIIEPFAPSIIKEKTFKIGINAGIIRNNIEKNSAYNNIFRILNAMEKVLYMIEKSITNETKNFLNLNNIDEDSKKDILEALNNASVDTDSFFILNGADITKTIFGAEKENQIVSFTAEDRTDALWKIFNNLKDQIKEQIGAAIDSKDKAERKVSTEISSQQGITRGVRIHAFKIRENDINFINEIFKLNWIIENIDIEESNNEKDKPETETEKQEKEI